METTTSELKKPSVKMNGIVFRVAGIFLSLLSIVVIYFLFFYKYSFLDLSELSPWTTLVLGLILVITVILLEVYSSILYKSYVSIGNENIVISYSNDRYSQRMLLRNIIDIKNTKLFFVDILIIESMFEKKILFLEYGKGRNIITALENN